LAELYIEQGFYDKGIEIYQSLLLREPGSEVLIKKLNDARARSKSASISPNPSPNPSNTKVEAPAKGQGPSIKGDPAVAKIVRAKTDSQPPMSDAPLPGRQSKTEKIQKLQAWLEQIKRSRKQ
jgi:hypothetical protein